MTSSIISSTATCDLSLGGAPLRLRIDKRARRLRLRVDTRSGGLTLTIPTGVSRRRALEWAAGHEEWAARVVQCLPDRTALVPGGTVPLFGRPHEIDWEPQRPRKVVATEGRIVAGGPADGLQGRLLTWLRRQALQLLSEETAEFAAKIERRIVPVSVGDPRSRWGSCSSQGAIRYSWRLIMAPDFVRRATVAHEVAHLVHMDHSRRFHDLVEELLGTDPAPARTWLRTEGASLQRIGLGQLAS